MKERYVNLEVAKLLRDKGFNEECYKTYDIDTGQMCIGEEICNSELTEISGLITAPTQQMACDWIEEKYAIFIQINRDNQYYEGHEVMSMTKKDKERGHTPIYYARVFDKYSVSNSTNYCNSIESAYNEVLKYTLTNLI